MMQFLIGFLCGCIATILVVCIAFSNKIRQFEEMKGSNDTGEHKKEGAGESISEKEGGLRVLLVDDSKLSRTILKDLMSKYRFCIYEAGSGTESLKLVKKHAFDLIFIDQRMPGMNGEETLQYLKVFGGLSDRVPVIVVGSTIRREQEEVFRKRGYVACLGKPFQQNRLDEVLTGLFPGEVANKKPEGFSYEKGLTNFDGNEEVFRETLVLFADLWEERKEQLRQFLEDENMTDYGILIHAIKGDARTLGAEHLGELAYAQELYAKAGDVQSVEKGFEEVIKTADVTAAYFKQMYSQQEENT